MKFFFNIYASLFLNKIKVKAIVRKEMDGTRACTTDGNYKILKEKLKDLDEMQKYVGALKAKNVLNENFELMEFLDSGGSSNVYSIKVKKFKDGKQIKKNVIMKAVISKKHQREVQKESMLLSKLKNKNIIDFYGASKGEENQLSFIFMEEAKYGNLRNFQKKILKRRILSESLLNYFAAQILNGIDYCHKRKIAHMDIKMQNIVINELLAAKLIDFSISINYQNKSLNEKIVLPLKGTNFYIPKEVLETAEIKYKDLHKVDLYSFGVVLYNLAFGCYPYGLTYGDEEDYGTILEKIKNNELNLENKMGYSAHFLNFLKRLLEKDINKRISLKEALDHYWIKGAEILNQEKEKCYNISSFLNYLLTDHIKLFNDYIMDNKL